MSFAIASVLGILRDLLLLLVIPCAVSVYGRVGLFQANSKKGCTGSSCVPIELYGRVTSATCVGLVSNRIRFQSVKLHNSFQCF